ncbi:PREDICTED: hyphal wall protein 1-like isoform X2 [Poecilia mexicana]|uniref:hyphal wall protein 1-like isoform X2 n=1 Tax=Poecilia mexicana TaxID=48701 RepID=UPI00072DF329|nr:PREDICTED: hyphal wall protein 1-like isoform X2 [Poecilia mexicana]
MKGRGALEFLSERRQSRNQDFKHPRRLLSLPARRPDCSGSGRRRPHRRPMYISFVTKAILWDRGGYHHTPQVHYERVRRPPAVCPRFLSHMKARPEDFHPPCYLNNNQQQQLPPEGKMQSFNLPPASQTDFLQGNSNSGGGQSSDQSVDLIKRRQYVAVLPRLQIPPTPPVSPSSFGPTPLQPDSPHLDPKTPESNSSIIPTPEIHPSPAPPQLEENVVPERETVFESDPQEPDCDLSLKPSGSSWLPSPTSLSLESLSHLSRPSSSLFSRSTNLASGRSSILSDRTADFLDSRPETSVGSSTSDLPPVIQSPLASSSPTEPTFKQPLKKSTYRSTSSLPEKTSDEFHQPRSPNPAPVAKSASDKPQSIKQTTEVTENIDQETLKEDVTSLSLDKELNELRLAPRSGSGPKLSPSPPPSRLDSQRWPVLPPISPKRGSSAVSGCSEISCSQSQMFDELEVIAPLSASSLSLDRPSDSLDSPRSPGSPLTDLSPGLAALTVGCDSGNLGSLSRVQLLLLDRPVPHTDLDKGFSPVQEWSHLTSPYELPECISPGPDDDDFSAVLSGHSRPLTAGSDSERCDSAGKLQENKSNWSDGGSASPSSWIVDPSPSLEMLRSSGSSLLSNEKNSAEDGPHHPERSSHVLMDGERVEERDEAMEERKTKALSLLSKLQDNAPQRSKTSRSRSNFEDFDFLAKYCIFSQEKLVEYKRAFEAEDSDSDGYISCLQVLLALKTIIPPELLSEKEEIYVYRILEMVDFRVTDGLVDLRLFAVIASLAQKIASMDEFMRSLIDSMDLRSLEVRLFKAKQLFLFLLEDQRDASGAQRGFISGEQLLLELKAGGIHLEQEAAVRLELERVPPLDLLDFLAYLPLFMLIHQSVIANPLDDSGCC